MIKPEIEIGGDLRSAAAEVAAEWKAAEAGNSLSRSDKIIFVDWYSLCSVLTNEQYDRLRLFHKISGLDAANLAGFLGRQAGDVKFDVDCLVNSGLLTLSDVATLSTSVDEIISKTKFDTSGTRRGFAN